MGKMRSYRMQQTCRMFCVVGVLCVVMCGVSSCGWKDAKEVIATAERMDKTEHVVYDDTAALSRTIRCLDNPLGKLIHKNTLGKAYYYMGRNLSLSNHIAEAAECYIEADRLQIDDPVYRGRVNSCMGYICAQNNNDSLALIFYERASNDFKISGNEWRYAQSLLNIIPIYSALHMFAKADSLLRMTQSYQLDSAYIARFYETKGICMYKQQQYDSALVAFKLGLDYWQCEEERTFSYLKLMQVYLDINDLARAIPYANFLVEHSKNPNYLVNAYYCLMQDAKEQNDVQLLSTYSHARTDALKALRNSTNKYVEAIPLLEDYLLNPYLWHRRWIITVCFFILCCMLIIGLVIHRNQTAIRLQEANKTIDLLSMRIKEQEATHSVSKAFCQLDKCINTIRSEFPAPNNKWNDYNVLKKDINPWLHNWLQSLEQLNLSDREKIFCTYIILYPHLTTAKLAEHMNYDKDGIRVFKTRIVQKLGIKSSQLPDFLRKLSLKE